MAQGWWNSSQTDYARLWRMNASGSFLVIAGCSTREILLNINDYSMDSECPQILRWTLVPQTGMQFFFFLSVFILLRTVRKSA